MTTRVYSRPLAKSRQAAGIYPGFVGGLPGRSRSTRAHKNQFRYLSGGVKTSHKKRSVNFRPPPFPGEIATLTDASAPFWFLAGLSADDTRIADGSQGLRNGPPAARAGRAPAWKLHRRAFGLDAGARGGGNHPPRSRARRRRSFAPLLGVHRRPFRGALAARHRPVPTLRLAGRAANGRTVPTVQRAARGAK